MLGERQGDRVCVGLVGEGLRGLQCAQGRKSLLLLLLLDLELLLLDELLRLGRLRAPDCRTLVWRQTTQERGIQDGERPVRGCIGTPGAVAAREWEGEREQEVPARPWRRQRRRY